MPKVFISYSYDSKEHRDFVRGISDRMRAKDGLDCQIDQYVNGSPPEGWLRWMETQIEQADFVLLVCTPNYLKRYRGEEREGGRGVTFEGVVISQVLYDHYYHSTKFIPVIPENGNPDHVPIPLKAYSCYSLPVDYDKLCRVLTGQPEHVAPPLGSIRSMPATNTETLKCIYSDRLPNVIGAFFGREAELKLLNEAWEGDGTRIIQFIAPGGTGKTKLLRHWLDHTNNIDALIAWSFYSQGASEDKQISASPFFSHAFEQLGSTRSLSSFTTEEGKGEHLADLLRQQRCVLVLDGLEPLQHVGKGMRGELKDRAVRQLLKSLAGYNNSLCIVTTRIAAPELANYPNVVSRELQNLVVADGVSLLKSFDVKGSREELEKAVTEYGCHALALSLLGNALHTYLDDDVRKRDTLTELIGDYDDWERHAFKVMQAYSHWLDGTPELKLLQLLGLFDHPIETEVLQILWQAQIPDLTASIDEKAWKVAIRDLREKHRLLSIQENRLDLLDSHPLIREYFGKRLREERPDAWRQAHTRLYEYYKTVPKKEFPDTLEEMQPLFNAVAHGCAAGLHQKTIDEVYFPRIRRNPEIAYILRKLGAFSDDLAVLNNYFGAPWHAISTNLSKFWQAGVQGYVGYDLRALGRLDEALKPMQIAVGMCVEMENWEDAAVSAVNLSELQLILGDINTALNCGQSSVDYAEESWKHAISYAAKLRKMQLAPDNVGIELICRQRSIKHARITSLAALANTQHQAGKKKEVSILLRKAEKLRKEMQPRFPRLCSLPGFYYCELLLARGEVQEVQERAEEELDLWTNHFKDGGSLDFSLPKLTLGCVFLQKKNFSQAIVWLDQAIDGLRAYGSSQHLPRGLLVRAALHRDTLNPDFNFSRAHQDLQEVFDIAQSSGMRLYLTDYHLEMARLLMAEWENSSRFSGERNEAKGLSLQEHVIEAEKLIEETGYKRRLPELKELQSNLSKKSYC